MLHTKLAFLLEGCWRKPITYCGTPCMFPVSIIFLFTIFIFPRRDTGLHPRGHRGSPVCGHQAADDRALQRGQHSLGQHHHQVAGHLPGMIITIIITHNNHLPGGGVCPHSGRGRGRAPLHRLLQVREILSKCFLNPKSHQNYDHFEQ